MSVTGFDFPATPPAISIKSGILADIGDAGADGSLYFSTDQVATYMAVSGAWVRVSVPAGPVSATLKATADAGNILLQGQAWPATTGIYADLYAQLGGSGGAYASTLPNFKGYTLVGKDSATFASLGGTVGAETVTLTSAQIPAHTHTLSGSVSLTGSVSKSGTVSLSGSVSLTGAPGISDPGHTHTFTAQTTHSNDAQSGTGKAGDNEIPGNVTGSSTTGITVNAGTLAVSNSLSVSDGISVSNGSLAVSNGLTVDNSTGGGGSHTNIQPSRIVNWQAKL